MGTTYSRDNLIDMVNLRQLDSTTRCPDIWSDIVLGMSVRVFLDEVNI